MAFAGASYWYAANDNRALWLATLFLAINWFGDSLDGTLARVRNRQRPRYGFYVDHIVDAFGTLLLMTGMGLSGYMSPGIAAALLLAYYLISINIYLATVALGKFRLSFWKFGPTELRVFLAAGNIVLFFHPFAHILGNNYRLFDVGGVTALVVLSGILLISVAQNIRLLYTTDRPKSY